MAADDEGSEDRTEEASKHKRDEWRKEGKVPQSRELGGAILVLSLVAALYGFGDRILRGSHSLFEVTFDEAASRATGNFSIPSVMAMFNFAMKALVFILGPLAIVAVVAAILGSFIQTGFVLSTKHITPDLAKIDPLQGFKRLASPEAFFELIKATVKMIIVGTLVYSIIMKWLPSVGFLWESEVQEAGTFLGRKMMTTLFAVGGAMGGMALLDFGFQKFRFEQKIRMTKQEVREERKQLEGNPLIRSRIRALQRKAATRKMLDAVKKADVVVTNPTHIAVALVYDRESMYAPRVVAKGADHMAERIKKIARENGVPCVENVPLARAMYKALKIGQFISRELYNAVAEVLAYVYRLRGGTNT